MTFFIGEHSGTEFDDYAGITDELANLVYYGRHLFEQCLEEEDLEFWYSIDPFADTIIETEDIPRIIRVAEVFLDEDLLEEMSHTRKFQLYWNDERGQKEIRQSLGNLIRICKGAIEQNRKIFVSGD